MNKIKLAKRWLTDLPRRTLGLLVLIVVWEAAVRIGLTNPALIPSASSIILGLPVLFQKDFFWAAVIASLTRLSVGYGLAIVTAVPLGFVIGWFPAVERYLDPLLQAFRQVPIPALFPLFVLLLGLGELPMIAIIMLTAFWWILLSTVSTVQNVDPVLVKIARSVGESELDMFLKVIWPAAVPRIFTALRLAYSDVLLMLLMVEVLGAKVGMGLLVGAHSQHGTSHVLMYSILLTMVIFGLAVNYVLVAIEKWLSPGREQISPA